jgi:putative membrane protein
VIAALREAAARGDLWQPGVLLESLALQALYLALLAGPLRRRLFPGAGPPGRGRVLSFLAAMWLLFLAFGSPLDFLADEVSFAAHMLQHVAETMWMAPLLLAGLPEWLWPRLFRLRWAERAFRLASNPYVASAAFNGVYLSFHVPALYGWALADERAHLLEHALFFVTAIALWWPVLSPVPGMALGGLRAKLVYLFANAYLSMPLAAALLVAARPWYAFYERAGAALGLSALGDQEWGAIVMMIGMFFAYAAVAGGLLRRSHALPDVLG